MFIPALAALIPLFAAPLMTHAIFNKAESYELRQIYVDNAGILLGRGDLKCLDEYERVQARLRHLERLHHVAHACALIPETAGACKTQDLALEAQIRAYTLVSRAALEKMWLSSWRSAQSSLLQSQATVHFRPPVMPLTPRRCSVCNLQMGWEVNRKEFAWRVFAGGSRPVDVWVNLYRGALEKWEYSLSLGKR